MSTWRIVTIIATFVAVLYAPAAKADPAKGKTVKTAMFGEVAIDDGAIQLADGGIHGVQGHTLIVPARGDAKWERRTDSMQPRGKAGSGTLKLTADESKQLHAWADKMWDLAPKGKASYDMDIKDGLPRWVWVIVLRRGDEVRVLEGGATSSPEGAPDPAKAALAWLAERVDAAAK